MIRDLLTPEAHRDPYVWAAVLLAHFTIGAALWVVAGWWAALAYAGFELAQGGRSRLLAWDSLLDWCGVTLGVAFASHLAHGDRRHALAAVVAVFIIAAVGYAIRARRAQEAQ